MSEKESTGPKPRLHLFGFMDETGLLHTPASDRFFGLGLVVVPSPRGLHRSMIRLKNQKRFYNEFKFNSINIQNLPIYKRVVDIILSTSNLRFNCTIVDKATTKVYSKGHTAQYNKLAGNLIANAIRQNAKCSEYITILADDISTNNIQDKFESIVRARVKDVVRRNALFGICRLESHAVTELQVCDVLIGAVAYAHKMSAGIVSSRSAKAQLVKYIQAEMNVYNLTDTQNIKLRNGIEFNIYNLDKKR